MIDLIQSLLYLLMVIVCDKGEKEDKMDITLEYSLTLTLTLPTRSDIGILILSYRYQC